MKYKDIKYPFVLYKDDRRGRVVVVDSAHGPRFICETIHQNAMGESFWSQPDPDDGRYGTVETLNMTHELAAKMLLQLQETEVEIPTWWNMDDAVDEIADDGVDILDALGPTIAPDAPEEPASIESEAE